jgi:hypothetical protein
VSFLGEAFGDEIQALSVSRCVSWAQALAGSDWTARVLLLGGSIP